MSNSKQGNSGLGIEAHRQAVAVYLNGGNWRIIAEFTEIESGKRSDRPAAFRRQPKLSKNQQTMFSILQLLVRFFWKLATTPTVRAMETRD